MSIPRAHTLRTTQDVLLGLLVVAALSCSSDRTKSEPGATDSVTETQTIGPNACTVDDHCASLTTHCAKGVCSPVTKQCVLELRPYGAKCIPDVPCALGICNNGSCQSELSLECDDANPCTTDLCDIDKDGCIYTPREADCDDGNPCTENDQCGEGTCIGGTYVCQECSQDEDCTIYNDDDACNGVFKCDLTTNECRIASGTKVICLSSKPCRSAHCNAFTGTCIETPRANGQPCHDGDLCTLEDRCYEGLCEGASLLCSDSSNACQSTECNMKEGCVSKPAPAQPCMDGNQCTVNDVCEEGVCAGQVADTCACNEDAECAPYDDDSLCTGVVRCLGGSCVVDPSTIVTCPLPAVPCISVQCAPDTGECVTLQLEGACTDGDLCTEKDQCVEGACQGEPLICDDMDECTTDLCIASIGCVAEMIPGCEPEGCTNGTVGLCGKCGTRICFGNEWGPCEGQKTCEAGAVETEACGNCGQKARDCSDVCEWNTWSLCTSEGVCTPGEGETQGCGNCGTQTRVCNGSCGWDGWSSCKGQGECKPKAIGDCDVPPCDGTKICKDDCTWDENCIMETCCGDDKCTLGEENCTTCPQDCACEE